MTSQQRRRAMRQKPSEDKNAGVSHLETSAQAKSVRIPETEETEAASGALEAPSAPPVMTRDADPHRPH